MSIVAHDLKNPLNTMVLRSHVMIHMLGESGHDELRRNLEAQERTAHHMSQLISDLTDIAKIQTGRVYLDRKECTVEEAVGPAIERIRLLAKENGIDLVTHLASGLPLIYADRTRITQVLDNLLGNALKFTPKDGRITVEAVALGTEVHVSVTDTGSGIPKDALIHVFEPYWQVQKSRSGMGLGLFIAKSVVEAHGGRIWADSTVGRGTTFCFTLPRMGTSR